MVRITREGDGLKNNYRVVGDDVYITVRHLQKEYETIISKSDFEKVDSYKGTWYVVFTGRNRERPYVYGTFSYKKNTLHRFLLEPKPGEYGDHINHDTLDNRRGNLRSVSPRENNLNRRAFGYSGSKNVTWDKYNKKWIVVVDGVYIGGFKDFEEAERVAEETRKSFGYIS